MLNQIFFSRIQMHVCHVHFNSNQNLNIAYFNQPTSQQNVLTRYSLISVQINLFIYLFILSFIHSLTHLLTFCTLVSGLRRNRVHRGQQTMAQFQIDSSSVFIKVLFKYGHTYSYYLGLLSLHNGRGEQLLLDQMAYKV